MGKGIQNPELRVAIVGAGVIGLSSAVRIAQEIPEAKVTVFADRFDEETTTAGAAGLWEPYKLSDTPAHLIRRWGKETFDFLTRLLHSSEAATSGVSETTAFQFWTEHHPEDPEWSDIVPHFRRLTTDELRPYNQTASVPLVDGWAFTTLVCEGALHLKWLRDALYDAGGSIKQTKIQSLADLQDYNLVINCSGLAAYDLVPDRSMYPIKGHVLRVKAPWIKHIYFTDEGTYVIPNKDTVVLGGTGYVGDWNTKALEKDRRSILERCTAMVPSLSEAKFVREWVGLRPGRPSVRLELEDKFKAGSCKMAVIHNYGHGGAGLTLAWGCAGHVVEIASQWLEQHQPRSRARL